MTIELLYILIFFLSTQTNPDFKLPINTVNRESAQTITLTDIGAFGLLRKERSSVPAHFHTGIDIKRPSNNYHNELIFPVFEGIIISKRDDGPYAQIIIEHDNGEKFWTVYEHVAGITISLFDEVSPSSPIARFMNREELNKYGWQFNHLHFEILKTRPIELKFDNTKPERRFQSFSLVCYTKEDLNRYFYNPIEFLKEKLSALNTD